MGRCQNTKLGRRIDLQLIPSGRGFGAKAKSELDRVNLDKQVDLDADITKLNAKVAAARERLESLQRAKSDPKIDADITLLRTKITQSEARLADLGRKTASPKVDVQTAQEQAKLARLKAQLDELSRKRVSPKVDADIAAAEAALNRVTRQADSLERKRAQVRVDADTGAANGKLSMLEARLRSISSRRWNVDIGGSNLQKIVGILAAIVAGLAAVASAAGPAAAAIAAIGAAGAGLAATIGTGLAAVMGGFSGVGDAISGVESAQKSAGSSAASSGSQQVNAARQIESAARSLQQAQQQQARTAIQGQQQVASAVRALQTAQIAADRAAITGAQQVAAARRALADAQIQAARSIADAEQAYTRSLQQERYAQEALTAARKDAQRAIEDLKLATSGAALSQERAQLNLERARQRLAAANAAGMPEGMEKQELDLDVREAEQSLAEVSQRYKNLKEDSQDASKAGVEGSSQVVAAQRALQAAQQSTADSAKQLSRAQVDGARAVQNAQIALAQAQQQAMWSQQDAARGVQDAEIALSQARQQAMWANQDAARAVADAQRQLAQAYQDAAQAGAAGAGGTNKMADALKGLSPAARDFVLFWVNTFKPRVKEVTDAVAAEMLPRIQAALTKTLDLVPIFKKGLAETGVVIGELAKRGAEMVTSGPWKADFATIIASSNRQLTSYGNAGLSLADSFRSIIVASEPMLERFARATERGAAMFNTWIQGKRNSGELGAFFDRTADGLAKAWDFAKKLGQGAYDLYQRLKPLGDQIIPMIPDILQIASAFGTAMAGGLSVLLPLIRPLVELAAKLAEGFNALPQPVQAAVGAFLLFILWGPKVAGAITGMVTAVRTGLTALQLLMKRDYAGAFQAMVPAAKKAGVDAGKAVETGVAASGAGTKAAAGKVGSEAGAAAVGGFRSKFSRFIGAAGALSIAVLVEEAVVPEQMRLSTRLSGMVDQINHAFTGDKLAPSTQSMEAWDMRVSNSVRDAMGLSKRYTDDGMTQLNTTIAQRTGSSGNAVAAWGARIGNSVSGAMGAAKRYTNDGWTEIDAVTRTKLGALPPVVADRMSATGESLRQGMARMQAFSTMGMAGVNEAIRSGIVQVPPQVASAGNDAVERFKQALSRMPPDTRFSAAATTTAAREALSPMPGDASKIGADTLAGMVGGVRPLPGQVAGLGRQTGTGLNNELRPLPGQAGQSGKSIGDFFGRFLGESLARAFDDVKRWLSNIIGAIRDAWNWVMSNPAPTPAAPRAQGALAVPMADGGRLQPVAANAAGRSLSPMSGARAEMVPANTWRIIGDNMKVEELFAPLNGSRRTASLLSQAAAHEGYVMLSRAVVDALMAARNAVDDTAPAARDLVPVGRYALGSVIQPDAAVRATAATHRYDTASRAVSTAARGTAVRTTTEPVSQSTVVNQTFTDSEVTARDGFEAANQQLALGRFGGAHGDR